LSDAQPEEDPAPLPRDPQLDNALDTEDRRERKSQRAYLFFWGGGAALLYLVALPIAILSYLWSGDIPILDTEGGWKALAAVDAAFAMMAFIPLSIFWTLAKITAPTASSNKESPTDGEALATSIRDACTAVKDMLTSILSAVRG